MRRASFASLLLLVIPQAAASQPADDALTETQRLGRQLFHQSCTICHVSPQLNSRTYGPVLSKDTAGGQSEILHMVIADGTPRMPAFKHYLKQSEIDAIIAYLKTVPTSPPAPRPAQR